MASVEHGAELPEQMMLLALQLGLLIFAAKGGGYLFSRMKLPSVLGELCSGIVIGPFLLGSIPLPGFPHGFFPPGQHFPVSPELYGICTLASIILLFMAGLESDLKLFLRYSIAGTAVGVGGVVVSFVVGDVLTIVLGNAVFGQHLTFLSPLSLCLGVISTATSVGITARILSEKRKLDSPEGTTILAGAVVDDVLGVILLSVVLGIVQATQGEGHLNWGHVGWIAAKAVGLWLGVSTVGILLSHRLSALLKRFSNETSMALGALGVALLVSGLFEKAGLAMIIGAYTMGLALSSTDLAPLIQEKLHPLHEFLVPIFFCVMGMLVDFSSLGSRTVLLFGLVYSITAVLAKVVGSGIPAYLFGFTVQGAARVGVGMIPRGEVALIVAGVSLSVGALPPDAFGVAILMTMITTMVAPPLLVALFKSSQPGLRNVAGDSRDEDESFVYELPSTTAAEWALSRLKNVFHSEGFFVHSLDETDEDLVQVRRERAIINLWRTGRCLTFTCQKREMHLVFACVLEVLSDLKRTIRGLDQPVDSTSLVASIQSDDDDGSACAELEGYIEPELMLPELRGTTKEDIIGELLEPLVRLGRVADPATALSDLLERERSMSTGIGNGIAIPHARTSAVSHICCTIGTKPEGTDFDSLDGKPSTIFVLILSPADASAPHLHFMSLISRALTTEICERLLASKSRMAMFLALRPNTSDLAAASLSRTVDRAMQPSKGAEEGLVSGLRILRDALVADQALPRLTSTDKDGVIRELLEQLGVIGRIPDHEDLLKELIEREALMSTGIGGGIAVPHCRTERVTELMCVIGVCPEGIDFGAPDALPATVVVLVLIPLSRPTPYIQFMASLVQMLNRVDRKRLFESQSGKDIVACLTDAADMGVDF